MHQIYLFIHDLKGETGIKIVKETSPYCFLTISHGKVYGALSLCHSLSKKHGK